MDRDKMRGLKVQWRGHMWELRRVGHVRARGHEVVIGSAGQSSGQVGTSLFLRDVVVRKAEVCPQTAQVFRAVAPWWAHIDWAARGDKKRFCDLTT